MKITVTTTPAELMDRGCWDAACAMLGFSPLIVSEGQMGSDCSMILSEAQAWRLGLMPFRPGLEAELEVNHLDGDPTNNDPGNLELREREQS
jgi:hypothetical protein